MAIIGFPDELLKSLQITSNISKALEFIMTSASEDFTGLAEGEIRKIEVSDGIHAICQSYQTKPDGQFEGHREYIDIQYMVRGREIIKLTPLRNAKQIEDYSPEKDIEWFHARSWSRLRLETGMVAILFPEDLHAPGLSITEAEPVIKVVVKVKI